MQQTVADFISRHAPAHFFGGIAVLLLVALVAAIYLFRTGTCKRPE